MSAFDAKIETASARYLKVAFQEGGPFEQIIFGSAVGVDANGSVCFLFCPATVIFSSNHDVASQEEK
jgi:hypothetical protein